MGIDFLLRWSPIPSLLVDVQGKDTKIWLVLDWKSTMDLVWSCDEGRCICGGRLMRCYWVVLPTNSGLRSKQYWCKGQTNSGMRGKSIWDCCRESCPLFRVLRYRTPSSPTYLSEVLHKPFALSRVSLLYSEGKSIVLVKEKAPSRSGFPLSMHVVLKTGHVNPNIPVRRY